MAHYLWAMVDLCESLHHCQGSFQEHCQTCKIMAERCDAAQRGGALAAALCVTITRVLLLLCATITRGIVQQIGEVNDSSSFPFHSEELVIIPGCAKTCIGKMPPSDYVCHHTSSQIETRSNQHCKSKAKRQRSTSCRIDIRSKEKLLSSHIHQTKFLRHSHLIMSIVFLG